MPKNHKFDWFRPARLSLATQRARKSARDTDELWYELRKRFPVEAWLVSPLQVPERWLVRDGAGRVRCIVIGGV